MSKHETVVSHRGSRLGWLLLGLLAATAALAQKPLLDVNERLDAQSPKLNSGEYAALHTVRVRAGQVVTAQLTSAEFTPYLLAMIGEGEQIDSPGIGGTSQGVVVVGKDSELRIIVTSEKPGMSGAYHLIVREGVLVGKLNQGDTALETGELSEAIPVWFAANATVTVTCRSAEFDPYLICRGETGNLDIDNTVGRGTEPQGVMTSTDAGKQEVQVTTHAPGESGEYRLYFNPEAPATDQSAASDGLLGTGDRALKAGEFFDAYYFYGGTKQVYTVRANSDAVDTYLIVVDAQGGKHENDDYLGETNAGIVFENPVAGMIRVQVTSAAPNEQGAYRLVISPGGNKAQRNLLREDGRLETSDTKLKSGEYLDTYQVAVKANQRVIVRAVSEEFDSYLIVQAPGLEEQLDNDDEEAGKTNSRLAVTPLADGEMTVAVTSSRGGQTGSYRLSVTTDVQPAEGRPQVVEVGAGDVITGDLADSDSTLESGEFYDKYQLTGKAGASYRVTVTSTDFDTYLIVAPPGGNSLDNDDAEDAENASQVKFEFPGDGAATIAVTSFGKGEKGAYRLQVEAVETTGPRVGEGDAIKVGGFFEGDLVDDDRKMSTGESYDVHQFDAKAGEQYTIDLVATDFDPYLIVIKPDRTQDDNDNEGASNNSRLQLRPEADGQYQIVVTSVKPGAQGHYTVSVSTASTARGEAGQGSAATLGPDGGEADARLEEGDQRLTSGELADTYAIELQQGQWLEAKVSSDDFDPYLIVIAPSGKQEENDDEAEGSSAAGLRLQAAETGRYRAVVTSYRPGQQGAYHVLLKPVANGPSILAANDQRKYWAVFAGINDYPRSPLRYCAEDAQRMAQAFEELGLVPAAQRRVLLNRDATGENIHQALEEMGRAAGPKDMLMFFFSGHGGQTRENPESNEADLRDEFILGVNGPILDDTLSGWLNELHAGLTLVYLDSCFSGGFAKDIITKPGRMGIFSSDEDLTSNVAVKFRAGGYLSHFMLKGVKGKADSDQDKVITAAELSYYLEDSFTRDCHDVESVSRDDQAGYQRVRIDRGGVKLATPLFNLP